MKCHTFSEPQAQPDLNDDDYDDDDDDDDDEPEVLLQHLVDGVGGHEAALHAEGKRLHEEVSVCKVGADLGHLDTDTMIM